MAIRTLLRGGGDHYEHQVSFTPSASSPPDPRQLPLFDKSTTDNTARYGAAAPNATRGYGAVPSWHRLSDG